MTSPGDLWLLLAGAIAGTYIWRGLGVLFASRISPEGPVFQWITAVSYAMLAGLISRMVLLPEGPLTDTPLSFRIIGVIVGLSMFFFCGRRLLLAVAVGLLLFTALVFFYPLN